MRRTHTISNSPAIELFETSQSFPESRPRAILHPFLLQPSYVNIKFLESAIVLENVVELQYKIGIGGFIWNILGDYGN